jgi:phosphopantetheinyl transferase
MCIAYLDTTTALADRLIGEFATAADHADAARHGRPRRQRQSLAVRALLRDVLAREVVASPAWQLLRDPQGHPREAVAGTARRAVSLAHSGELVACATATGGAIGVDVERIAAGRPILGLAQAAFGPTEIGDVERDGVTAFYRIWTLREALAKASAEGFELLVNRQDLVAGVTGAERRRIGERTWDLAYWTVDGGYALAVAREAHDATPIPPPWNIATLEAGRSICPA